MNKQPVIESTRRWIRSMVIWLGLCPFAQRVFEANKIRYVVTDAEDETPLLEDLANELKTLASALLSILETTLLIHPRALGRFLDYNDFLGPSERLVKKLGLRGAIQIASFHPDYQFAGADAGAVENFSNRAPHPMLHLLREDSITRAADDPSELFKIPQRNSQTLRSLGRGKILQNLRGCSKSD
jgi:uncharacterized protein